ncbi:mannose-6-phosphate isomerase, class I [Nocardiopsis baichengensis]|uniref:mannose-6-phosphate isomerase, class I n=1 Tax=Nocardiopsis baichengensis TaxID=280240 RepID=UPI0003461844|nr:mannose-6-phosphate isomerase, class I [Nocardiopsis baichengensis]
MHRLINQVRPYAWGAKEAIPRLLGAEPDGSPQAELWMGAHPAAPSTLLTGGDGGGAGAETAFDAFIADAPKEVLGKDTVARFGERLPFLLKVLAAESPLSLQAHPDEARARAGFAAEEAEGIPVNAADRNYRDPFHKPELVLALEPFEALCGFRDPVAALGDLAGIRCELARRLRADLAAPDPHIALRTAMTRILTLDSRDLDQGLAEFIEEWAHRGGGTHHATVLDLVRRYPGDPGAVAALLLNRITLRPGEALFLPAGNVHAYLRGTAVEIMASSDNVLRAGLTAKHVDVPELLAVVDFSVLPIPYTRPVPVEGRSEYRPGVDEFSLAVLGPGPIEARMPGGAPSILLALDGGAELRSECGAHTRLTRGQSVFVPASSGAVQVEGTGHVVAATVGF